MNAKEELAKILNFDATLECKEALIEQKEALLRCKEEDLERLSSIAEKVTATTEGEVVSRSRNLDPLGTAIAKKSEKEKEINRIKKEIKQIQKEIEQLKADHEQRVAHYTNIIDNLKNPVFIKILYGKYLLGKTLRQIAREMNYTVRNVRYLHGNALQAVENAEKGLKK